MSTKNAFPLSVFISVSVFFIMLSACTNTLLGSPVPTVRPGMAPDAASKNLFYIDKGWAAAGLSAGEFQNLWEMANLTARIYDDLWDSTLDAISPYLIPSLDFDGNSSAWRTVEVHAEHSGFYAELARNANTGDFVLLFRGTNALSLSDWVNNIQQALYQYTDLPSAQYTAAVRLARDLKARYPRLNQIAGHSLGGGLAQLAALDTGIKATCFNAAGLSAATLEHWNIDAAKIAANKPNITHCNIKYDPLSDTLGKMDGKAPFAGTPQYGGKTYWMRNITGTGFTLNPLRIANHMYHAYVYNLKQTARYFGNFL